MVACLGVDFARVADAVAGFLLPRGHRVGLAGALALHAYGISRLTFDLDFVTDAAAQSELLAFVESLGYSCLHSSAGFSNHVHADAAWGRLDVIYVDRATADKLFSESRASLRLGDRDLPVPRPEHLAAMKVQAMKNDPSRKLPDMADVQSLLRLPGVDAAEVRGYFERAGLSDEYEQIRRAV